MLLLILLLLAELWPLLLRYRLLQLLHCLQLVNLAMARLLLPGIMLLILLLSFTLSNMGYTVYHQIKKPNHRCALQIDRHNAGVDSDFFS